MLTYFVFCEIKDMFDIDIHMVRLCQALGDVYLILQLDWNAKWSVMTLRAAQ